MSNRRGNETGSFEVNIVADRTKFTIMIIKRLRERAEIWSEKVRWLSQMKPRFRAESVVLSEQLWITEWAVVNYYSHLLLEVGEKWFCFILIFSAFTEHHSFTFHSTLEVYCFLSTFLCGLPLPTAITWMVEPVFGLLKYVQRFVSRVCIWQAILTWDFCPSVLPSVQCCYSVETITSPNFLHHLLGPSLSFIWAQTSSTVRVGSDDIEWS